MVHEANGTTPETTVLLSSRPCPDVSVVLAVVREFDEAEGAATGAGATTGGAGLKVGTGSNFGTGITSFISVGCGLGTGAGFFTTTGFLIGLGGFTTGLGLMGSFLAGGGAGGGSFATCFTIGSGFGNITTSITTGGFLCSVFGVFNKNNARVICNTTTTINNKPATRRDFFCCSNGLKFE